MSESQKKRVEPPVNTSKEVLPDVGNSDADSIDILELLYRLLSQWKKIACVALAFAIISGIYTVFFITPKYEATSTIYVLSRTDSAINFSDLQLGTALTQDYIKVFKMWEVHEEVISNLNLPYTYKQMRDMLTITNEADTRMIDITITSPDAKEAASVANEYAKVASQFIAETMSTDKPNIMSVALVPTNHVSPSKTKNILLGFMLGAAVSCGYIAVCFILDDKFKTAEDIRKYTGLTTLAVVPVITPDDKKGSGKRG